MRLAVTGRAGQVACSLLERGHAAGHEVIGLSRPELDLADPSTVTRALLAAAPDAIVSAAAYTAVDKAQSEPELAYAVNASGAGAVAAAAHALNVPLIHISTDYIFDGTLDRPYVEYDAAGPIGIYGASKLAGEAAALAAHRDNTVILRVAWVYSPFGGNFVKTMLRLGAERDEVAVVADQVGNPTSALDIASGILQVAENLTASSSPSLRGVFHMTAPDEATWADLAEAVFAASADYHGPKARVRRITSAEYPTPAVRPANSRLNSRLLADTHGVLLPSWRDSVAAVVARLVQPNGN